MQIGPTSCSRPDRVPIATVVPVHASLLLHRVLSDRCMDLLTLSAAQYDRRDMWHLGLWIEYNERPNVEMKK